MIISNRKRTKGHPWIPTTMGEKARWARAALTKPWWTSGIPSAGKAKHKTSTLPLSRGVPPTKEGLRSPLKSFTKASTKQRGPEKH